MKFALAAAFLTFNLAAIPATAATFLVELQGDVYYNNGDVADNFPVGTKASAWFKYNSESAGQSFSPGGVLDPSIYFYPDAVIEGGMNIGDYSITFSDAARMFVTNQERVSDGRVIDRILFDDFNPVGGAIDGREIDVVSISWQDDSANALSDLSLPTSGATFDRFPAALGSVDWTPYIGAEHRVSFRATQQRITEINGAVPEPSTWLMMLIGFGLVGGAARASNRQRKVIASLS